MLVLAHRGYHRDHPENTMAAFAAAVAWQVDGIETDIRETADGALVLFHDAQSPRGDPVSRLTHRGLEEAVGYSVPTLEETLLSHPGILWNLEVKPPANALKIAQTIRRFQETHRLLVTSFDHELIAQLLPRINADCGLLFDERHDDSKRYLTRRASPRLTTIVVEYGIVDDEALSAARELGMRVFAYGVVSRHDHARCVALDLAGIITDYPDRMDHKLHHSS